MKLRKTPKELSEQKKNREELLLKMSKSKILDLEESHSNAASETEIQHISIETMEGEKPKVASQSPSALFPTPSPITVSFDRIV